MNRTEFLEHLSDVCEVKPDNLVMIVDEEGALHDDRKLNLKATELVTNAATKLGRRGTLIFGNVAVVNQNHIK